MYAVIPGFPNFSLFDFKQKEHEKFSEIFGKQKVDKVSDFLSCIACLIK